MKLFLFFLAVIILEACSVGKPSIKEFNINPKSINVGDSVTISWNVANADDAFIAINNMAKYLPSSGSWAITIDNTTTFTLIVEYDGNQRIDKALTVDVKKKIETKHELEKQPKPTINKYKPYKPNKPRRIIDHSAYDFSENCASASQGDYDGRFTIGAVTNEGHKRLMYGYPIPHSTSHFVINIDGNYASNSPYFDYYSNRKVCYLTGDAEILGDSKSIQYRITYHFDNVIITQFLIPVDSEYNDVEPNSWGQYYRIEYEFSNLSNENKNVGIFLLIDTMIDDNDAAKMKVSSDNIFTQKSFTGDNVPNNIYVYLDINNEQKLKAVLNTSNGKAVKPDALYIGKWPVFHSTVWNISVDNSEYYDSAIILLWENINLSNSEKIIVATHYGLPGQNGRIQGLLHTEFIENYKEFFYDMGKTYIYGDYLKELNEYIEGKKIIGAIVEGYSDAVGSNQTNERFSKIRANKISDILVNHGINEENIIIKFFGERYAKQNKNTKVYGSKYDRKVVLRLLIED